MWDNEENGAVKYDFKLELVNEDEYGEDMPHAKEESVLELKEAELIIKINQEAEGHELNVVKKEEECYVGDKVQHNNDKFEMNQVVSEWLKSLLKEIAVNEKKISQVLSEIKVDTSFHIYDMIASI